MTKSVVIEPSPVEARSYIYGLFARAFSHPDEEFLESVYSDQFIKNLYASGDLLPYCTPFSTLRAPLINSAKPSADIDIFYASTFEAGQTGVSLRESSYSKKAEAEIFESAFRFYEHFGLNFENNKLLALPDQLSVELEFMHYLSYLQSTSDDEEIISSLILAQKDFLQRHLSPWITKLALKLTDCAEGMLYDRLGQLLELFITTDEQYLIQSCLASSAASNSIQRRTEKT